MASAISRSRFRSRSADFSSRRSQMAPRTIGRAPGTRASWTRQGIGAPSRVTCIHSKLGSSPRIAACTCVMAAASLGAPSGCAGGLTSHGLRASSSSRERPNSSHAAWFTSVK